MKYLKAFGQFWYDFVIGDDWKIAVGVVLALAATFGIYAAGAAEEAATVIGAVLVLAAFSLVLVIDQEVWRRS